SVEDVRVRHQGQVDQVLDLPVPKLGPDSIIFAPCLIAGRMRRPVSAAVSQVCKAYLHSAVAPIHSLVEREAQTRDDSNMVRASSPLRQNRKPIFGRPYICGE